jgi:hypothetical protein
MGGLVSMLPAVYIMVKAETQRNVAESRGQTITESATIVSIADGKPAGDRVGI